MPTVFGSSQHCNLVDLESIILLFNWFSAYFVLMTFRASWVSKDRSKRRATNVFGHPDQVDKSRLSKPSWSCTSQHADYVLAVPEIEILVKIRVEKQLLFISTSVWVLGNPNAGRNLNFQRFLCKKLKKCKKVTNLMLNLQKGFFKLARKKKKKKRAWNDMERKIITCNRLTIIRNHSTNELFSTIRIPN